MEDHHHPSRVNLFKKARRVRINKSQVTAIGNVQNYYHATENSGTSNPGPDTLRNAITDGTTPGSGEQPSLTVPHTGLDTLREATADVGTRGPGMPTFAIPPAGLDMLHNAFVDGERDNIYERNFGVPIVLFLGCLLSMFLLSEITPTVQRGIPECPELVRIQSNTHLRVDVSGNQILSLEIKNAEMDISEQVLRVRFSNLKSRQVIARILDEIKVDAKETGYGLQNLTAKVGGAIDEMKSVNDHALQRIGEARAREHVPWLICAVLLWSPWKTVDEVVLETFTNAMDDFCKNMRRLGVEAEIRHTSLIHLEEKFATLRCIITREAFDISKERDEFLGQVWTKLGRNHRAIKNLDDNLALLKCLGTYTKQARHHVAKASQTLRAMDAIMKDMRERVGTPGLVGSRGTAEVQIRSIQMSLERLRVPVTLEGVKSIM